MLAFWLQAFQGPGHTGCRGNKAKFAVGGWSCDGAVPMGFGDEDSLPPQHQILEVVSAKGTVPVRFGAPGKKREPLWTERGKLNAFWQGVA